MGCVPQAGEQICTMALSERSTPQGVKTLITLTAVYPTKEARDAMLASGMERGVSIGYDQLEQMLAAHAASARS
jgi:hypothetical protein